VAPWLLLLIDAYLGQAGRWQSPYHDTMIDHDKNVGGGHRSGRRGGRAIPKWPGCSDE
jgi:hypothetical protein